MLLCVCCFSSHEKTFVFHALLHAPEADLGKICIQSTSTGEVFCFSFGGQYAAIRTAAYRYTGGAAFSLIVGVTRGWGYCCLTHSTMTVEREQKRFGGSYGGGTQFDEPFRYYAK